MAVDDGEGNGLVWDEDLGKVVLLFSNRQDGVDRMTKEGEEHLRRQVSRIEKRMGEVLLDEATAPDYERRQNMEYLEKARADWKYILDNCPREH